MLSMNHARAAVFTALSVGSAVYITIFVMLMGLQQALLPVLSELHGANRPDEVGRQFRQSLYLWALNSVVGMLALLWPAPLLHWTDVPEALQPAVHDYLRILAWSLPPALLFRLFSTLNQSLGRPKLHDGALAELFSDLKQGIGYGGGSVGAFFGHYDSLKVVG